MHPSSLVTLNRSGFLLLFFALLLVVRCDGQPPPGREALTEQSSPRDATESTTVDQFNPPEAERPLPEGEAPLPELSSDDDIPESPPEQSKNNCNQEECVSPPLSTCVDGQQLRTYESTGVCHPTEDRCIYGYNDTPCPDGCSDGRCLKPRDQCQGVQCDSPFPSKCISGRVLRTYEAPGTCQGGMCSYPHKDTSCPHGCKNARCLPDPCKSVKCETPPASKCDNSSTLRNYYNPGRCNAGKCTYSSTTQKCPHGCEAGKCKPGPGFTPLRPFRFLDTRGSTPPGNQSTRCIKIAGKGGVPTSAKAVYINLVAVAPTANGYLSAYPRGIPRPTASTLNYAQGRTIANGAIVALGTNDEICVYIHASTHIIVDVYGYFSSNSDFFPRSPFRRLDTRSGSPRGNDSTQCYKITGRNGIPQDAKAVFINAVAVAATGGGFLTMYPRGATRPVTSNLNYDGTQAIANGSIVRPGSNGEICIFVKTTTHLILDITGYFGPNSSFIPINPLRKVDSRQGSPLGAQQTRCHTVAGSQGIPSTATAVALNITAIAPTQDGFLTLYPDGLGRPSTSNLNYQQSMTLANNALVQPGSNGKICIYSRAQTHYALDIVGYWQKTIQGSLCAGVTCNNPPPTTCVGGKNLVSYNASGTCRQGVCVYPLQTQTCSYQCVGQKCVSPPPPPPATYHPVTSWQSPSQPVSSGSRMSLLSLRYITLHYNGGNLDLDGRDNIYQDSDFAQILRNMQGGYVRSRGYSLGYNSAIAPDGDEWEIRGFTYRCAANGCSAVNRPAYAIIIPLRTVSTALNSAQIRGVQQAIARVRARARAAGNTHTLTINGHRDVRPLCGSGGTACPGSSIYGLIQNGTFK